VRVVLSRRGLICTLVAGGCAWAMLRHSRQMLFEGVSMSDGGGWAALVIAEFTASLAAIAVALS
jgi:hypothetical protein